MSGHLKCIIWSGLSVFFSLLSLGFFLAGIWSVQDKTQLLQTGGIFIPIAFACFIVTAICVPDWNEW